MQAHIKCMWRFGRCELQNRQSTFNRRVSQSGACTHKRDQGGVPRSPWMPISTRVGVSGPATRSIMKSILRGAAGSMLLASNPSKTERMHPRTVLRIIASRAKTRPSAGASRPNQHAPSPRSARRCDLAFNRSTRRHHKLVRMRLVRMRLRLWLLPLPAAVVVLLKVPLGVAATVRWAVAQGRLGTARQAAVVRLCTTRCAGAIDAQDRTARPPRCSTTCTWTATGSTLLAPRSILGSCGPRTLGLRCRPLS
mmetsp:Transcript_80509/g.159964  ORF Transcript_80509/g.159964 Transcript_80509/m.159964 type:complete len:252 (+) Transcript_80509:191-946(+)